MVTPQDRENFIPFRKTEIIELLCQDGSLAKPAQKSFQGFCKILRSLYHLEFHQKLEALKDNFAPFDPDRDTCMVRPISPEEKKEREALLFTQFQEVLRAANYQPITEEELAFAVKKESLLKIQMRVRFEEFENHLLFQRGDTVKEESVKRFLRKPLPLKVPTFERVALFLKYKGKEHFSEKRQKELSFTPGTMTLKLFRNIPKADLEMLYPNTQIGMTIKDKLLLGVPGLVGGVGVLLKAGAALLAAFGVVYLLLHSLFTGQSPKYPSPTEMASILGAVMALGGLGAFLFRQWSNYKNRKIFFMKTLTDNLYFRNLDNNAGVFHRLIDAAEEEECKEAMLAYYFLLNAKEGSLSKEALDARVEEWFEKRHNIRLDFEVEDALKKLKKLGLCELVDPQKLPRTWRAVDLDEACRRIDHIWDNYFHYANGQDLSKKEPQTPQRSKESDQRSA